MRPHTFVLLMALLFSWLTVHTAAHVQDARRLFAVGISGGFTGAVMTATAYSDGTIVIQRSGAGQAPRDERRSVPLTAGAVKAASDLAGRRHIFAIPKAAQDGVFGADIPVLSLTIYGAAGAKSAHAMGSEANHVPG